MSVLPWIADRDLSVALDALTQRSSNAREQATTRMRRNIIDPFSSLIIASILGIDDARALKAIQENASALSGIGNALGSFHQQILGAVKGWRNHDAGYDLENTGGRIVAELKNKHNTMNAANRQAILTNLDTAVQQKGRGWTGYLVIVIPRTTVRYKKRLNTSRPVFEIDGASFYAEATGSENALRDLFFVLMKRMKLSSAVKEYCKESLTRFIP